MSEENNDATWKTNAWCIEEKKIISVNIPKGETLEKYVTSNPICPSCGNKTLKKMVVISNSLKSVMNEHRHINLKHIQASVC